MLHSTDIPNRIDPWGQAVYVQFREEIDPFAASQHFRPLNRAYDGDNTFWSVPSPEPDLDDAFWELLLAHLTAEKVEAAIGALAQAISSHEPDGKKLVFAAILRAGVPIADWLCRLIPGAVSVSLSLFVGLGIDQAAMRHLGESHPDRKIIFVDGWTGRGGVAREIAKLNAGPLAVLNDPWGWADFSGCQADIFCPSACFTGAGMMGFSRTFFVDSESLFAAYRFPRRHCRYDVVKAWQNLCPTESQGRNFSENRARQEKSPFFRETHLRLHSNEVCRALINADPDTIHFLDDTVYVREHYPLLLALADIRKVRIVYDARPLEDYKTRVACSFKGQGASREKMENALDF